MRKKVDGRMVGGTEERTREGSWARGYIMGNDRGIPRDQRSSPVRMRRADQFSPSIHHPLPTIPLHSPFTPSPLFCVPGVLAAPEESTESRGIWPRCLFALSTLLPSPPFDHPSSLPRPSSTCTSPLLLIFLHLLLHFFSHSCYTFFSFLSVVFSCLIICFFVFDFCHK